MHPKHINEKRKQWRRDLYEKHDVNAALALYRHAVQSGNLRTACIYFLIARMLNAQFNKQDVDAFAQTWNQRDHSVKVLIIKDAEKFFRPVGEHRANTKSIHSHRVIWHRLPNTAQIVPCKV